MERNQKNILVIDDDSRNIFALCAVLKSRGYQCLTATSGREGIEILSSRNDIGVILLDMMMPEMDGYEATRKIKSFHTVPVVAVTAQAMVGDREKCLEAGADEYIAKPIDIDKLISVLNEYLR
jgi:two-component system, cell cycle response regulator DivK